MVSRRNNPKISWGLSLFPVSSVEDFASMKWILRCPWNGEIRVWSWHNMSLESQFVLVGSMARTREDALCLDQRYKKMRRRGNNWTVLNRFMQGINLCTIFPQQMHDQIPSIGPLATLQVLDFVNLGSPLSLRSPARLKHCGDRFSLSFCFYVSNRYFARVCKVIQSAIKLVAVGTCTVWLENWHSFQDTCYKGIASGFASI